MFVLTDTIGQRYLSDQSDDGDHVVKFESATAENVTLGMLIEYIDSQYDKQANYHELVGRLSNHIAVSLLNVYALSEAQTILFNLVKGGAFRV